MRKRRQRFALVVSRFNQEITAGLLKGALEYLREKQAEPAEADIYDASGAFEIPLLAQELARTGHYDGIICLGCVIKGETAHFEYISSAAAHGLMQAALTTRIPMGFGILTAYNEEQARRRSADDAENKGREAAAACLAAANTLREHHPRKGASK